MRRRAQERNNERRVALGVLSERNSLTMSPQRRAAFNESR
jgi:hypothetical protein